MAWSLPIWKIFGFPKVSLYLERFVLKHATAHIHQRYGQVYRTRNEFDRKQES
jgi:hypothetical protein